MDDAFVIAVMIIMAACYCAPTIVAFRRKHPNRFVIAAINVVGGMTVFLWVMTLIWALQKIHIAGDDEA